MRVSVFTIRNLMLKEGADVLLDVINNYDSNFEKTVAKNKKFLETLSPYNPAVYKEYEKLLEQLFL